MYLIFGTVCFALSFFCCGDFLNLKGKYISGAFLLLVSGVIVKAIGAVYKIPLTSYIGTVGRGYYAFAYNLVLPLHAVTMGAFPIALSKLVSEYRTRNDCRTVLALKKGALRLFFFVGLFGMLLLLLCAKPYCELLVKSPKSIYAAVAVTPSLFFSCVGGAYRGYYEGSVNMIPTAVSQITEAVGKFVFGIVFSKFAYDRLVSEFDVCKTVLGKSVGENDALSVIYPYSTAAAMLGVTVASFLSLSFLTVYSKIKREKRIKSNVIAAEIMLLRFAFRIMVSSCVQSIFQFLDSASVQLALNAVNPTLIRNHYLFALSYVNVSDSELSAYACGVLSASNDFKNLVPGITMSLGICAVPVISSSYENRDNSRLSSMFNAIFKYTSLLSSLGGLIIFVCADDALTLLYSNSSPDIPLAAAPLVRMFALTVSAYSLSGLFVFCVQSVGMAQKSIPSYIVCGIIRVVLNIILIKEGNLLLYGYVISSLIGYAVLAVWNLLIFIKRTKIKADFFKTLLFPLLIEAAVIQIFVCLPINNCLSENTAFRLIENVIIVTLLYMVPCFLCGMLNFNDFFRYLGHKKCR